MNWQRKNVLAALEYIEAMIAAGAEDARTFEVRDGLREVLQPQIRVTRLQRERELDQMDAHGEKA